MSNRPRNLYAPPFRAVLKLLVLRRLPRDHEYKSERLQHHLLALTLALRPAGGATKMRRASFQPAPCSPAPSTLIQQAPARRWRMRSLAKRAPFNRVVAASRSHPRKRASLRPSPLGGCPLWMSATVSERWGTWASIFAIVVAMVPTLGRPDGLTVGKMAGSMVGRLDERTKLPCFSMLLGRHSLRQRSLKSLLF